MTISSEKSDRIETSRKLDATSSGFDRIPVIRPTLPDMEEIIALFSSSYRSGIVTSGRVVSLLEQETCRRTEANYCVALSSCTSGLILSFASQGFPEGGEVIVPSFTFSATAQAILWNRLVPVYVDCLPDTLTVDPDQVARAIEPETVGICAANVFGLPPEFDALADISEKFGIPLVTDSAQGLGSTYGGRPAGGFGLCEVFSLSPSKVVTALEGGLVTTNDAGLAETLKNMRDYGKGSDGETIVHNGLSARMSELHAAVGLLSLRNSGALVQARLRLMQRYTALIGELPGCSPQRIPDDRTSSGNYYSLLIGDRASLTRENVAEELLASGIESKRYFSIPVHLQPALRKHPHRIVGDLPNTLAATRASLILPLFAHMTDEQQDRVCSVLQSTLGCKR